MKSPVCCGSCEGHGVESKLLLSMCVENVGRVALLLPLLFITVDSSFATDDEPGGEVVTICVASGFSTSD